jgi:Darcynin, domain of unknown function
MKYVFFVLLRATSAWLSLTRERRRALSAEHLAPLLKGNDGLKMRYFDAEAFSTACSDVMMIETDDPKNHYFFMEHLRDSPLMSEPYFEVVQIVPAIEDGYIDFEQAQGDPVQG